MPMADMAVNETNVILYKMFIIHISNDAHCIYRKVDRLSPMLQTSHNVWPSYIVVEVRGIIVLVL